MYPRATAVTCVACRLVPALLPVLVMAASFPAAYARDQASPAIITKLPATARTLTFGLPAKAIVVGEFPDAPLEPMTVHLRAADRDGARTLNPAPIRHSHEAESAVESVIMMKPFVVTRAPVRLVFPRRSNGLLEAVKSGILYRHTGRILASDVVAYGEPGPGGYGRIKIGLSFSW